MSIVPSDMARFPERRRPPKAPRGPDQRHISGPVVIPDGPKDQTSDAQLRIGESRDSGFDASHRPGMTNVTTSSSVDRNTFSGVA